MATQPRPQGLLAFQYSGGSGEKPRHTADHARDQNLQRGWRFIQNGGYGEKSEKIWVRDMAKVKINKIAEKAEVQFKKKRGKNDKFCM